MPVSGDAPDLATPFPAVAPNTPTEGEVEPKPTFLETMWATGRTETSIGALAKMWGRPNFASVAGFDAFAEVQEGDVLWDHPSALVGIESPEELEWVRQQVIQENKDRDLLRRSGAQGFAALGILGFFDPLSWIPLVGATQKARMALGIANAAGNSGKTFAKAAAAGITLEEALLWSANETRTWGESAANITAGTLAMGALGTAIGAVSASTEAMVRGEARLMINGIYGGSGDIPISAKASKADTDPTKVVLPEESATGEEIAGILGMSMKVPGWMTKVNPGLRLMASPFKTSRINIQRLADTASYTVNNKNLTGAKAVSAESWIQLSQGELYRVEEQAAALYINHRTGASGGTLGQQARAWAKDKVQRRGADEKVYSSDADGRIQMTVDQFYTEVGRTMRNPDLPSHIPQVNEAATLFREYFDGVARRGIEAGVFTEDLLENHPNFLSRLYDHDIIKANRGKRNGFDLEHRLERHFFEEQNREISEQIADVEVELDKLTAAGEKQLKDLEAVSVKEIEAARAPTPQEAQAAARLRGDIDKIDKELLPVIEKREAESLADFERARDALSEVEARNREARKLSAAQLKERGEIGEKAKSPTKRALLARYTAEASSIRKVKADAKVRLNERRSMAKRAREQRRIKEREIGAIGEQYEARFRKTSEGAGVRLLQEREKVLAKIASASKGAAARITKLEAERFGMEDSAAVANYAVESILGTHVGRNPYDVTVKSPASKPLKNRKITLSDAELDNWLVHDVRQVAQAYVRTVVPDVEIAREFGDVQASKLLKSLDDEAKARREIIDKNFHDQAEGLEGETKVSLEQDHAALVDKLDKAKAKDSDDLEAVVRILRGNFGAPENPDSMFVKSFRYLRQNNLVTMGGGFGLSSTADVANIVAQNGLIATFDGAFRSFYHSLDYMFSPDKALKRAGGLSEEMHTAAIATEMFGDNRALLMAGEDFRGAHTRFDKAMEFGVRASMHASLLTPWNNYAKWVSGAITAKGMSKAMRGIANGTAKKREIEDLLWMGITQSEAAEMHEFVTRHARKEAGGLFNPRTLEWGTGPGEDFTRGQELARLWRVAWRRGVDNQIVTPSAATKPLLLHQEWGKAVGQFKTHSFVATDRTLLTNLQRVDMRTLNAIVLGTSLGAMIGWIKTIQAGKDPREQFPNWQSLVIEGVDRSGQMGWLMEPVNIFEKVTGRGLRSMAGAPMGTRYAARNVLGTVIGPFAGQVQRTASLAHGVSQGWTQNDTKNFRRMWAFQAAPGFQQLFNAAEEGINNHFGVPKSTKAAPRPTR